LGKGFVIDVYWGTGEFMIGEGDMKGFGFVGFQAPDTPLL
jgi:hypothetical protein